MREAEAARTLEKAVKLDPKIRLAHLDLGILSIDSKEYERAKSELDRAIGLDSNKSDAHFQLARMYRAMGREKEAHAELEIFAEAEAEREGRCVAQNQRAGAEAAESVGWGLG